MRVLVFGTFDHLHPGHLSLFDQARELGDTYVIVARDNNVKHIKGRKPDQSEEERLQAVKDTAPDTEVILGDEKDYLVPVQKIQPDLILLGYDQKLPPGINIKDLPCPIRQAEAYKPEKYKSSLRKGKK